jgi:predicted nucleic acid-binding Zn ribbon protein
MPFVSDSPKFDSQAERPAGAAVPLSGLLDAVISELGLGQKMAECRAQLAWDNAVGSQLAQHAQPVKVKGGRMEVAVSSPVWSSQLSFMKADILKRINLEAGSEVVTDLSFVTAAKIRGRKPTLGARETS